MPNFFDLKNKKILVTGANGQLGRALVSALLQNGAFVFATDLQDKSVEKSDNLAYLPMDITSEKSIKAVAEKIKDLDVLINNAGIGVYTPFEARTETEIDQVMDVNLKGTIFCLQEFSKLMIRKKRGKIINIGSIYGVAAPDKRIYGDSGRNSSEIYGATKAGVIQMTKYFAAYLGEFGIQVNAVSPGGIFNHQKQDFVSNYARKTPLRRMASPDDLTGVVCFLSSDDSNYITGQNIIVDGGFTLNQ